MTPNLVKAGKCSTISEVVRGPLRKRSRIDRRVGSDSAFQTGSKSSGADRFLRRRTATLLGYRSKLRFKRSSISTQPSFIPSRTSAGAGPKI